MDQAAWAPTDLTTRGRRNEAREEEEEENEPEKRGVATFTAAETTSMATTSGSMSHSIAENESQRLRRCRCKCLRLRRRRQRPRLDCRFRSNRVCREVEGEEEGEEEEEEEKEEAKVSGGWTGKAKGEVEDHVLVFPTGDCDLHQLLGVESFPAKVEREGQDEDCFRAESGPSGTEFCLPSLLRHPQRPATVTAADVTTTTGASSGDEWAESARDGRPTGYAERIECAGIQAAATASVRHRKRRKWRIPEAGEGAGTSRLFPTTPVAAAVAVAEAAASPFSVPHFFPSCSKNVYDILGLCRRRRIGPCSRRSPARWAHLILLLCSWATLLFWSAVVMPRGVEAAKGGEFRCDDMRPSEHAACIPQGYSKYELPDSDDVDNITRIDIQLAIQEVLRINDKDYSISFSTYFNVFWHERRIRLRPDFGKEQLEAGTKPADVSVPTNLEFCEGPLGAQHPHLQPQELQSD